jgi:hypothetical protein
MKKILLMAAIMLALPMMAQEEDYHQIEALITGGGYELAENVPAMKINSFADLINKRPAMPTANDLLTPEAKTAYARRSSAAYYLGVQNFRSALLDAQAELNSKTIELGKKQKQTNKKAMEQYNANVNAGLMPSQEEMMQMMMSGEINPNWPEEKIMDAMAGKFAAKWGVSKQEYIKIINMAQKNPKGTEAYLKSNHPDLYKRLYAANAPYGNENVNADDPRKPEFDRINDELLKAQDDLQEVRVAYGENLQHSQTHSKYITIYEQMQKEWDNSPEAKQIEAIETALQKRLDAWYLTLTNEWGEVPYPAWYTTERKKENALIDQWNKRWATKWIKVAEDGNKAYRPIFRRIAELGEENDRIGEQGDTEEMIYLTNKKLVCTLYGQMTSLYIPIRDAMAFPAIEHVETTGYTIVEAS